MRFKYSRYIIFLIVLLVSVFFILSIIFPLPSEKPYSTVLYDRNGNFLKAFLANDGIWRLKTSPEEIPEHYKNLIINKEDRFFYYHFGVNPFSIVRALVQNIISGKRVSGASTITMQVARMLEPKKRTIWSKLIEVFRAIQLEVKYSKDEILQLYLSMIPLGGNVEGLKSGAMIYYQTPIDRLNIAQLFDLIVIPNDPNDLRPDKYPERLNQERWKRAKPFFKKGILTKADSIVFAETPSAVNRKAPPQLAPHFCYRVKSMLKYGDNYKTTLDLNIQSVAEQFLSNHLRTWKLLGVKNGALIVIENKSMNVVAYVGSENFDDSLAFGQVDAVQAIRSPGSTLKPFLYAFQMDNGVLTPKTRLLDVPYDFEGYTVENYDGTYSGYVFADEALRKSLNVPMIYLLKEAGLRSFCEFLCRLGFNSLQYQFDKLGLSMIIGGCGVTLEELATAYATFPNGGMYAKPRFLLDQTGINRSRVFSEDAAFMITEILTGVERPDMPNNFIAASNLPVIAFKTGTSYGRRDAWCFGYTAEYTVGVWIGNVTNKGNPNLVGSKSAAPLLVDILNSISRSRQKYILKIPDGVGIRDVCVESGKLPGPHCKHTIEDYYSILYTTSDICDVEKEYLVSPDKSVHYCGSCLGNHNYKSLIYKNYPKELLNYWRKIGKKFSVAPPHNPLCERVFGDEGPKIISPTNGMTYIMFSNEQNIVFQASSGVDVRVHYWYLNNNYLGKFKVGQKIFKSLETGEYTVSCMDDKGRLSKVVFKVNRL